jgi:hypothetical protein
MITLTPKPLDKVLGAIIIPRTISLVHGPLLEDRSPLITLMHAVVTGGALCGTSVYLSSTRSFKPRLIRALCPKNKKPETILNSILRVQLTNLDHLQTVTQALFEREDVNLVVLDGLMNILGLSEFDGVRKRQRYLYGTLELLRDLVNRKNLHFMITGSSRLVLRKDNLRKKGNSKESNSQKEEKGILESHLFGGNVLLHNVDTVVRLDLLKIDEYYRLDIERTPVIPPPDGSVIRISHKGIRSIK